eukprot:4713208-Amphidinium_carterae.3
MTSLLRGRPICLGQILESGLVSSRRFQSSMVGTRRWTSSSTTTVWRRYIVTTTSPQTMGSLYEIVSLTTVGYNGYNGSNDIHLDRQSPRHLNDFWSIIIDTGAAVSVCPMTLILRAHRCQNNHH